MNRSAQTQLAPLFAMSMLVFAFGFPIQNESRAADAGVSSSGIVGCGLHGGVIGEDGTERPINPDNPDEALCNQASKPSAHFMDTSPLAQLSDPPKSSCGSPSAKSLEGKTSWQRGYDQAMSGTRFKIPILTRSGTLHPELKACSEYPSQHLGAAELNCCLTGFRQGYADLQRMILNNLMAKQPAPQTPEALLCYRAFGEGRHAADVRCQELSGNALSCKAPQIDPKSQRLGCASVGYLAQIGECPMIKAKRKAFTRALEGGALSGAQFHAIAERDESPDTTPLAPANASSANEKGSD